VLASGGLRQTRDLPYEERAEHIFSDKRMQHRTQLFRAFVVPELKLMTEQNPHFCHLVFVSPEMPSVWRAQLDEALERVRHQIVPVEQDENLINKARSTAAMLAEGDEFLSFRVDDDDALPSGYMQSLLDHWPGGNSYKAVAWEEGYFIKKLPRNRYMVDRRHSPLIAIGLGVYSPRTLPAKTVFCFGNHKKIDEKIEVVRLIRPRWIRTVHDTNDSMARLSEGKLHSQNQFFALLDREFPAIDKESADACL
jgi:hypothetical protein